MPRDKASSGEAVTTSVLRLGHPSLRFAAEPVEVAALQDGALDDLVTRLRRTLEESEASVLTAPQLGAEVQVMVVGTQIIVNPMLELEHGELVYDWETCLSIPGLWGLVPRHPTLRLRGIDETGAAVDIQTAGSKARALQHAHDHLSGVLFIDRMRDLRSLAFHDEWQHFLGQDAAADNT